MCIYIVMIFIWGKKAIFFLFVFELKSLVEIIFALCFLPYRQN